MRSTNPAEARFDLRRRIGAGGFGEVFEAWDRSRDSLVALKRLKRLSPVSVRRFKHEFRSLAHLSHPNLAQLYELVSDGEEWSFTMELVEGVDFVTAMRLSDAGLDSASTLEDPADHDLPRAEPVRPCYDVGRLRASLRQLVRGVHALHRAGKLHRDIKPQNVLVTPQGRVVILDFGMVRELKQADADPSNFVGTPHYMAPEQAQDQPVTTAADWYSVGVMLFEVLTGDYPVHGRTVVQLLLRKQMAEAPTDEAFAPGTPEDLRSTCQRLLALDPDARPTADELLELLGDGGRGALPAVVVRDVDQQAPLVGRAREQAELHVWADSVAESGSPGIAALIGPSGIGKSALGWQFVNERRQERQLVWCSRCWENESVPYKALDGIIDSLVLHLSMLPEEDVDLMLTGDVAALARVFPAFEHLPTIRDFTAARPSSSDSPTTRRAAFRALRALLRDITSERALTFFIDDAQWGDRDSADALVEVLSGSGAPAVSILMTYRDGEAEHSPFLGSLGALDVSIRPMELSVLNGDAAGELARACGASEQRVAAIVAAAGGDPYLVQQLAEIRDAGVTTLEDAVHHRLDELHSDHRAFIEVLTIAGKPIDASVLHTAAAVEADLPQLLARLRNQRLLRLRASESDSAVEPYHDRVRQVLIDRIPAPRRRALHLRLAQTLQRREVDDPQLLALHFREGGEPTQSAPYSRQAAEAAMEMLAYDRAATAFQDTLRDGEWGTEDLLELQTKLGTVLSYLGRGNESAEAFVRAAVHGTAIESVALRRRAAEQLLRAGQLVRGRQLLDTVLAEVGVHPPRSEAALNVELVRLGARAWWRGFSFSEPDEVLDPMALERLDTLWTASNLMGTLDVKRGAYFMLLNMRATLDTGEPDRLARTLALQAVHSASRSSSRPRAYRLLETADRLIEQVTDPDEPRAMVDFCRGMRAYMVGDVRTAHSWFIDVYRRLGRLKGYVWERKLIEMYDIYNQYQLGLLPAMTQNIDEGARDAAMRDDLMQWSGVLAWSHLRHLVADDPDASEADLRRAEETWNLPDVFLLHDFWRLQGEVRTLLYRGEAQAAVAKIDERWSDLRKGFFLALDLTAGMVHDLRGRAYLMWAATSTGRERSRAIAGARRDARKLGRIKLEWTQIVAQLLHAQLQLLEGDEQLAKEGLARVESELGTAGYELCLAAVRVRLGELLGAQAGDLEERTRQWFESRGVVNPAKFVAMLVPVGVRE